MQHASKVCNTKIFEIADIDGDSNKQAVLRMQMVSHQALSLTKVIPCYMPNVGEIIPEVLDFDEQQLQHYPDESKVPKGGWLGPGIAKRFRTKRSRMLITGFLYLMSCAFSSTPRFSRLLTSMMIPTSNAGVLQVQMANHQAFSLTIVIPCYMPNEEEIILAVLDFDE